MICISFQVITRCHQAWICLSHCCLGPVYTGWSVIYWNATGMPLLDPVYTGILLGDPASTCRVHWSTTGKAYLILPHTWMPLVKLWLFSLRWNFTGYSVTLPTPHTNSSNVWGFQHQYVHALDISTFIVFVYLGLQFKWNQLRWNNYRHTNFIHKGLQTGKWPGLLNSKPDSLSTLGYQWTDYDYTGTTMADAMSHWCPSGNTAFICIRGTH